MSMELLLPMSLRCEDVACMWRQVTFLPGLSFVVGVSVSHNAQHGLQGIVCAEVTHIAKHRMLTA